MREQTARCLEPRFVLLKREEGGNERDKFEYSCFCRPPLLFHPSLLPSLPPSLPHYQQGTGASAMTTGPRPERRPRARREGRGAGGEEGGWRGDRGGRIAGNRRNGGGEGGRGRGGKGELNKNQGSKEQN